MTDWYRSDQGITIGAGVEHFDGENDFLQPPAPRAPVEGVMVCVSAGSSYKWNALLGAWVKTSGEGPNFVRPNKPPEADGG